MSVDFLRRPFGVVAFVFPIATVLESKLTPVFLIGLLVAAVLFVRPLKPRFWMPLVAAFAALLAWAALSALWSIDPMHSLGRFGRLLVTVGAGVALCGIAASKDFDGRREVGHAFALGLLVASVLAVTGRFLPPEVPESVAAVAEDLSVRSFGSIAAVGVFVVIAMLEERPVSRLLLLALSGAAVAIALRGNSASAVALIAGIIVVAAVFWLGRKAVVALAVGLPLLFVSSGAIVEKLDLPARAKEAGFEFRSSTGHRLIIWRFVNKRIQERPALGWGLHVSRLIPGREGSAEFDPDYADIRATTPFYPSADVELMPMHPHNATLQTRLELGIAGTLLYASLFALYLMAILRLKLSRLGLAAGAGGVVAVFMIGQLSFSVWQSWWLCAQFLAAALFLFVVRPSASPMPSSGAARSG